MGSPKGEEVARISVRVLPDTSTFAAQLRKDLEQKNLPEITVKVNFDVDPEELYAKLAAIKVPTITVPVDLEKVKDLTLNLDVDTTKATAQVDAFVQKVNAKRATIRVNAEIDQAFLGTQLTKLTTSLGNRKIKIGTEIDKATLTTGLNNAAAQAATFFKNKKVSINVDVDKDRAALAFSSFGKQVTSIIGAIGGSITSGLGSAFSKIGEVGGAAGSKISGAFDGVSGTMGRLTAAMGPVVGSIAGLLFTVPALALELFKASAMATAIAVAGAGIAGAWGLASAAIAAVPAVIGLLGAPIAAVMLGMDGIKKAAQTLKPEFDKLKAAVSATFEKGLTQVFTQLKGQMTALTPAIQSVATSLIGLAQQTANWITKAGGAKQIQTMFLNIAAAIKGINLVPLLDGFTKLAGNQAALGALVSVINQVGTSLQDIANNTSLNEAFKGLGEVTNSLLTGLTALVNNGIKLFASAWPGMKAGLDGITAFFGKFNWASLGAAVGGVFKGIGDALKSIPQGTVDAITRGFQGLAATFQSAGFQQGVQGFASAMPALIAALDGGVQMFAKFGEWVGWAVQQLVPIGGVIETIGKTIMSTPVTELGQKFIQLGTDAKNAVTPLPGTFSTAFSPLPGIAGTAGQGVVTSFNGPLYGVPAGAATALSPTKAAVVQALAESAASAGVAAKKIPKVVADQIGETPKQVKAILDTVPAITGAALTPTPAAASAAVNPTGIAVAKVMEALAPAAGAAAAKVPGAVGKELAGVAPTATTALDPVPKTGTDAFTQLGATPGPGMDAMKTAVDTGLQGVATALGTSLQGLPPIVTQAFTTMQQAATTGVGLIGIGIQAGMPGVQAVLTTAFTALGTTAIIPAFTAMQQQATTGVGLIGIGIQTGMVGLTQVVLAAFTSLGTLAVLPAFTAIGTTIIPQALTLIGTAITTGITTVLTPLVLAAFTTLGTTAILPAFTAIGTTIIPQGLTILGTAIGTGFTTVLTPMILTAFTALGTTAFLPGFTALSTTIIPQGLTILGTAIALGFTTLLTPMILAAFITLGTTAFLPGFTALATTIIPQGLTILGTAIGLGFTTVLTPMILAAFTALGTTAILPGFTAIATTTIPQGITAWATAINTGFTTVLVPAITKGWADMNQATVDGVQPILETVNKMVTDIQTSLETLVTNMKQIGDNITTALANAITAGQSKVVNAIVAMVQAALAAAFAALGINSPSKEFQFVGSSIPEGTSKGIDDNVSMVVKSVDSMANAAIDAGSNIFIPGPTIGGAQMAATTQAATAAAVDLANQAGSQASASSGTVINIKALPSATAVQLANEVTYRTTYARQGVHSGR